jgi:hypothetical protein
MRLFFYVALSSLCVALATCLLWTRAHEAALKRRYGGRLAVIPDRKTLTTLHIALPLQANA